ncbi:MAG TPA: hypothetical protein VL098_13925 [Flavipsychrobacter sp.]|nr:hypothetical protein [Flavipsychrobacter sp.]
MIRSVAISVIVLILVSWSVTTRAQAVLPDLQIDTQKGINVLSWLAQFDGIKSIAVQRSSDSIYNFTTIGYVKNVKKGAQGYVDAHPLPGKNFYRLYIAFNSDLTWYSNRIKIVIDSTQLLQKTVLPPNDSLQKMVTAILEEGGVPDASTISTYSYTRSQYVFTNPFTGHINIELPEEISSQDVYSLRFFDSRNVRVFDVPKVSEQSVILDKRNFQRKGMYKFEMKKNNKVIETGFVTIY